MLSWYVVISYINIKHSFWSYMVVDNSIKTKLKYYLNIKLYLCYDSYWVRPKFFKASEILLLF